MITRAELLHNLALAQLRLAKAKAEEIRWRMLVALKLFPNPVIGTNWTAEKDCKMVAKVNISFNKDKTLVTETMTKAVQAFPSEAASIGNAVDWEYVFKEVEYNALSDEAKKALAPLLTIKPATPTIEVKKVKP